MRSDPNSTRIASLCAGLVGAKINLGFTATLQNGKQLVGQIDNCNIVGDCMENIVFSHISSSIETFTKGPKQASPDFFNEGVWEYELKCYSGTPGFDIGNVNAYIDELEHDLQRKLSTQYLIFEYSMCESEVTIQSFRHARVWGLLNYAGKYPLSLQCKRGMWYNLRPCSARDFNHPSKTPDLFIQQLCLAIESCPNQLIAECREEKIKAIKEQWKNLI